MTVLDQAFIRAYNPPTAASEPTAESVSAPYAPMMNHQAFRPMLQVEDFSWPRICRRLDRAAGAELDALADALTATINEGRKVLAMLGCRRGDGATTLLLTLGRRLARRGLKVVMADADLANPELARRLGVRPEHGWQEASMGRIPLEEVVIESTINGVALLPAGENAVPGGSDDEATQPSIDCLDALAAHYDVVLVDVALPDDSQPPAGAARQAATGRIDAVVLVHNVRDTSSDALAATRQRLSQTGLAQAGVIENFVRV